MRVPIAALHPQCFGYPLREKTAAREALCAMQSARRDPWRWVTALAVVRFDDTQGQVLDYQFPPEEVRIPALLRRLRL